MSSMTQRGVLWPLIYLALSLGSVASAQDDAVDISEWECELCPFPSGLYLDALPQAGYVSDDSLRFGNANGLDEQGGFINADIDVRWWGEDGYYWDVVGTDLGHDSRSLESEGGRLGVYEWRLSYSKLPSLLFDTTDTPFLGSGGDVLTLPAGWVDAGTTQGMTALNSSLLSRDIEHERENFRAGFSFFQNKNLSYSVDFRHEDRDGTGFHAGDNITQGIVLPEPIDYSTDEIDVAVTYTGKKGQIEASYFGSFFNSSDWSLSWDNPFTNLAPGADRGRSAMPPDNKAYQFNVSGGYQVASHTRVSGLLSTGKMEQDDLFLPSTINPTIVTMPLSMTDLDGEVDTTRVNLTVDSRPMSKLRLRFRYDYDDRENDTSQLMWEIVQSDLFVSGMRTNLPYSFERNRYDLQGDYRLPYKLRLSAGYNRYEIERDLQERSDTDEDTGWLKLRARDIFGYGQGWVKVGISDRDGSTYRDPLIAETTQNPLMRKYNMADREREFAEANYSIGITDNIDINASYEYTRDDYDESTIGLTDSRTRNFTVDSSILLPKDMVLGLFVGHEQIDSDQSNSENFAAPNWFADNKDTTLTLGMNFKVANLLDNKLDLGLDYTYSDSEGETKLTAGGMFDVFPDFSSRLNSAELYADYRWRDRTTIRLGWYYEKLDSSDWHLDGVLVDTIPSVLTMGAESPDYDVSVITLSFTYSLQQNGNE